MNNIPYLGMTHGIFSGTSINQTICTYASQLGVHYFRIQQNMKNIWINQSDPPSAWSWSQLDAAVNLALTNGFEVVLTVDDFPSFDTGDLSLLATSEPFYLPTSIYQLQYALAVALRYNGVFNIPTYGPMYVRYLEMGNETYNIHFTPTGIIGKLTLNQNLTAGQQYSSIAINSSTLAAPVYSICTFNPTAISPDNCQLTTPLEVGSNPLVVYFSGLPATTVTTDCLLYTQQGSTDTNVVNSKIAQSTGWGEIVSQGTLSNWAGSPTEPNPSDFGWLLDSTILEGSNLVNGSYNPTITLTIGGANAVSIVCDVHVLYSNRDSSSALTLFNDVDLGSITLTNGIQTTIGGSGIGPTTAFTTGQKLAINIVANITTNNNTGSNAHISIAKISFDNTPPLQGNGGATSTTPGYGTGTVTSMNVQQNAPGTSLSLPPFTPRFNHTIGETINVDQRGIRYSPYSMYNGLLGTSQPHQPQPARDPQFMQNTIRMIFRTLKQVRPDMIIGAPAIWWVQGINQPAGLNSPGNHFAFTSGFDLYPADIYKYIDYMNFHYYSNSSTPQTGGALAAPYLQAINGIHEGLKAAGLGYMPIWNTEIGWQVPGDTSDATRAGWFTYCLQTLQRYAQTYGKDCKFFFYNIDAQGAQTAADSLINWVSGTTYTTTLSYNAVQNFVQNNPSFL